MEVIWFQVELGHLRCRYFDSGGIGSLCQFGFDLESRGGSGFGNQIDDGLIADNGLARQFCVMKENMRCSILFHLLVPGGKCDMCRSRPVRFANRCSPAFHSATGWHCCPRIGHDQQFRRAGVGLAPMFFHQARMLSTANSAVS